LTIINFKYNGLPKKIKEEISFYRTSPYAALPPLKEYLEYLEERIRGSEYFHPKMNIEEYARELDILVFQKSWAKLKDYHKMMKIKEYLTSLNPPPSSKILEILLKKFSILVHNKKFNHNAIEYDSHKMCIVKIKCLKYINGKYRIIQS
jgi:hypothetical protein